MKDPLFGNKVAAALLTTALLAIGLPIIFNTLAAVFGGHHGHHDEDNPFDLAYTPVDIVLEGAAAGAAAPEVDLGTLLAEASVERGERAAGLCGSCHTFGQGEPNGIGPNLWNIVGKDIASVSGFGYTGALQGLEGNWTYEKLDPYLANSQAYVPGTQMAQMVRKDQKRADILAYLGSLSSSPVPFPEPAPIEEEPAEGEAELGEDGQPLTLEADQNMSMPGQTDPGLTPSEGNVAPVGDDEDVATEDLEPGVQNDGEGPVTNTDIDDGGPLRGWRTSSTSVGRASAVTVPRGRPMPTPTARAMAAPRPNGRGTKRRPRSRKPISTGTGVMMTVTTDSAFGAPVQSSK